MPNKQRFQNYLEKYLNTIKSSDYEDLRACINADIVWDDGQTRRNPISYELFATHEHLDFVKEDTFKFSGEILDTNSLAATAEKVEKLWQALLPKMFPGHEFVIMKDLEFGQIAFFRKRTGITSDPDEIITYLEHWDHTMRWNALLSAALYPHPKLVPHLIRRLNDDDMYNILNAVTALGVSHDESVIEVLRKRFLIPETGPEHELPVNSFFTFELFKALIKLGRQGYNIVFELFKNHNRLDSETLEDLCELMAVYGGDEALEILLEIYFSAPESGDAALTGLIKVANRVLPGVIPLLSSGEVQLRQKVMWLIANSYEKNLHSYLVAGLKDANSSVREAAVYGIGRFYHRTRKKLLLQAAYDRAVSVRVRAIEALSSLSDPTLLGTLQSLCMDKSPKVRLEAMRAVAALESKQSLNFLNDLYDSSTNPERLKIIKSLYAHTGDPSHLNAIIAKALSSKDRRIIRETNDLIEMLE